MARCDVALGDPHHPWANSRSLRKVIAFIKKRKPRRVIQLGDLYDRYSDTRFARDLNVMTPQREHELGRREAEKMWEAIREAAGPKCELYQLRGNHDDRPMKRAFEKLPDMAHIIENGLAGFWSFPGVQTVLESKEELVLDGVFYTHGHYRFGAHLAKYRLPVVCGHLHKGGIVFERISLVNPRGDGLIHRTIFEANAGYLGDPMALPLKYRQLKNVYPYTQGLFLYDEDGPRFVELDT